MTMNRIQSLLYILTLLLWINNIIFCVKKNISFSSILVINREVYNASFNNIKRTIAKDQSNDHFNYPLDYSKIEGYSEQFL